MTTAPSSTVSPERTRRPLHLLEWLLRVALALVFVGGGLAKLGGDPAMVAMFDQIGAGQGLRFLVGGLEVAGSVGVLIPRLAGLAASGLALLMVGATITNLTVLDTTPAITLLLLALAALVVWLRRIRLGAALRRRPAADPVTSTAS